MKMFEIFTVYNCIFPYVAGGCCYVHNIYILVYPHVCIIVVLEKLSASKGSIEKTNSSILDKMDSVKRSRSAIIDRPLSKGRQEVCLSVFALLFSEMVQYSQDRVRSVAELQAKLSDFGEFVGSKMVDLLFVREKNSKREIKVLNILLFVKGPLWKALFGKEADKLEQASDDDKTYYIIEKTPIITKYVSAPKDKSSLNCAAFAAGIVEAVLSDTGFPAKVTTHWHKGTTLMIKFDRNVIARDKYRGVV